MSRSERRIDEMIPLPPLPVRSRRHQWRSPAPAPLLLLLLLLPALLLLCSVPGVDGRKKKVARKKPGGAVSTGSGGGWGAAQSDRLLRARQLTYQDTATAVEILRNLETEQGYLNGDVFMALGACYSVAQQDAEAIASFERGEAMKREALVHF